MIRRPVLAVELAMRRNCRVGLAENQGHALGPPRPAGRTRDVW